MKLVTWNINGIRAVVRKGFFEWLDRETPDVLCLQETKAHPDQLKPELTAPLGYRAVYEAAKKKGYSGVSTWTRSAIGGLPPLFDQGSENKHDKADKQAMEDEFPAPIGEARHGLGIARFDAEGRALITEFESFVLVNAYFPNSQRDLARMDYKVDFCDSMLGYCNRLRRRGKRVVICGDVNIAHKEIDLARPKENVGNSGFAPEERACLDRFVAAGYVDAFRKFQPQPGHYTWWSYLFDARARNVGWRIDYFLVSDDLIDQVEDCYIQPEVMGSDHCPVVLKLKS